MIKNNRLRELRASKGMSRTQFADSVQSSKGYIAQIENGERNLSMNMAKKIGAAFNIPWISLFQPEDTG